MRKRVSRKNNKKNYLIIMISIFSVLSVISMSIGYAAFNTEMSISGEAYVRVDDDIRITNIKLKSGENSSYEKYNSQYSKESTTTFVSLPANKSITYEVTIENATGNSVKIANIIEETNNNSNIKYELKNLSEASIFTSEEHIFTITLTNNTSSEQEGNLSLKYEFEEYQQITTKCVRGGRLHTEVCNQIDTSKFCSSENTDYSGYDIKNGDAITYGSLGTGAILESGNAFTCDVNGDGYYDEEEERFYYVSDLYTGGETGSETFDTDYAVLIYYNNTTAGVADNTNAGLIAYHSDNVNNLGPVTALPNLPSTSQWSNINLKNQTRQIRTETGTTSTSAGTISSYTYTDKTARLITYQELRKACGASIPGTTIGYLDNPTCRFLMENTKYSNGNMGTYGYWLETPALSKSVSVWYVVNNSRKISYSWENNNNASGASYYGVRPAIEVLKTDMDLEISKKINKVSFEANGGNVDIASKSVIYNNTYGELPTPTKDRYKFIGWYTDPSFTNKVTGTSTVTINENHILYAKWEAYKCIRATTLHKETCNQTDTSNYCSATGSIGAKKTITYGQLGTKGTLNTGDAFTCDVNGDGIYNEATERFYYVSNYYDPSTNNFNTNYATLIYYNNTTNGVADNTSTGLVAYNSANVNNKGPVTALKNLPSTTQWSNVSLKTGTRQIRTEKGTTSTSAGTISSYTYTNKAARLITYQEIIQACGTSTSISTAGYLDTTICRFLLENTKYSNSSIGNYGYWLETPCTSYSNYVWAIIGDYRRVGNSTANLTTHRGIRPTIEVLKTDIAY